jgi:hypothetical protein
VEAADNGKIKKQRKLGNLQDDKILYTIYRPNWQFMAVST